MRLYVKIGSESLKKLPGFLFIMPLSPWGTPDFVEDKVMKMKSLLLLAAFAFLVAPAGCIFSPDDDDGGGGGTEKPPVEMDFPGDPETLMKNFRTVYEEMDFDSYADMLRKDYITILQTSTQDEFPDVGATLDWEDEIVIAERMFSGQPFTNSAGDLVPGISSISFDQLEQQGDWTDSPPNDVIPNARLGLFEVIFRFDRPGFSTLMVQGQIKFYIDKRDSVHNGATRDYWQLIGQKDETRDGP